MVGVVAGDDGHGSVVVSSLSAGGGLWRNSYVPRAHAGLADEARPRCPVRAGVVEDGFDLAHGCCCFFSGGLQSSGLIWSWRLTDRWTEGAVADVFGVEVGSVVVWWFGCGGDSWLGRVVVVVMVLRRVLKGGDFGG